MTTPNTEGSPLPALLERVEGNPAIPPDAGGAVAALGAAQERRRGGFPKGAKRDGGKHGRIIRDGDAPASAAPSRPARTGPRRSVAELEAEVAGLRSQLDLRVMPDDQRVKQAERSIEGFCAATEFVAFLAGAPEAAPDEEQTKALKEAGAPAIAPYMERLGVWGPWLPLLAVLVTVFITNWKRVNAARAKAKELAPASVVVTDAAPDAAPPTA